MINLYARNDQNIGMVNQKQTIQKIWQQVEEKEKQKHKTICFRHQYKENGVRPIIRQSDSPIVRQSDSPTNALFL